MITVAPPAALASWVESLWYHNGVTPSHARERVLPLSTTQVLVNLDEDELRWCADSGQCLPRRVRGAAIGGAFSTPIVVDTAQQRRVTGLILKPGGVQALFGLPVREMANDYVSMVNVTGLESARDHLLEAVARGPGHLMQAWFDLLNGWPDVHSSSRIIQGCHLLAAGSPVMEVADRLSLSQHRFRDEFYTVTGFKPKTYGRLCRLQSLVRALAGDRPRHGHFAELAAEHGYFDQAHMIQEFRHFTGTTPGRYRPRDVATRNHLPCD